MTKNVNHTARLQWKLDTIKNCIYLQCIQINSKSFHWIPNHFRVSLREALSLSYKKLSFKVWFYAIALCKVRFPFWRALFLSRHKNYNRAVGDAPLPLPPDFDRSINPISSGSGADYARHIDTEVSPIPPGKFPDLPTALYNAALHQHSWLQDNLQNSLLSTTEVKSHKAPKWVTWECF